MSDALRTYRFGVVAAFAAGGGVALVAIGIRDEWPMWALACALWVAAGGLLLALFFAWLLEADGGRWHPPAPATRPHPESLDPRFPITATDPALASELLLASLATHPPRTRGPAT